MTIPNLPMEPRWSIFVGTALAVVALVIAARDWRARRARGQRPPIALLISVLLLLTMLVLQVYVARRPAALSLDSTSLRASFTGILARGPQRQLVFQYRLENTTQSDFHIGPAACSPVSFRFVAAGKIDPAASLLEKDAGAYQKYTGLVRLPNASPMAMEPCPLDFAPGQSRAVEIAIPYAYPDNSNPSAEQLQQYVRAVMPRVDGFGAADLEKRYQILFPRGW